MDYIASTTYSDNFIFFPDSTKAISQRFIVKENPNAIEFPPVDGENVAMFWSPTQDFMTHSVIDKPIAMYDMKSKMHGKTIIEPDGLSGDGIFEFEKAELEANLIKFKYTLFLFSFLIMLFGDLFIAKKWFSIHQIPIYEIPRVYTDED